jgi:purine-binding chemotaxis protein CheW
MVRRARTAQRAARTARAAERRPDEGSVTEYLGFRVASSNYALPVSIVREIARSGQLTPVPRAPPGVLGISSFRGRVITVIDLGSRLGLASSVVQPVAAGPVRVSRLRILMVDIGPETLGFLVDEVLMVYRLSARDIERATTVGSDVGIHVTGIARPAEAEDVVLLLDPKALVP